MPTTPGPSVELLEHARQLREQRRFQESAAAYHQLIESGAHQAKAYYGLGLVHLDAGDLQSAATAFERSLNLDAQNANAYYYLGEIWTARQAPEIAQSFYTMALAINPQHAGALKRRQPATISTPAIEPTHRRTPITDAGSDTGFYGLLQRDTSPLAREIVSLVERLTMSVRPSLSAHLGRLITLFLAFALPAFALMVLGGGSARPASRGVTQRSGIELARPSGGTRLPFNRSTLVLTQQVFLGAAVLLPVIYIVRIKTTRYTLGQGRLQISRGVLLRRVSNIELYRVVDLEMRQTFLNRLTRDGTIVLLADSGRGQQLRTPLTGIARGAQLQTLFESLRSLVLLLRTGNWGKGFIM